jgi:hypothetical protein
MVDFWGWHKVIGATMRDNPPFKEPAIIKISQPGVKMRKQEPDLLGK